MKKPFVSEDDNGDLNIEFIEEGIRFGFFIAKNNIDSGWFFADKKGEIASGEFSADIIRYLERIRNNAT